MHSIAEDPNGTWMLEEDVVNTADRILFGTPPQLKESAENAKNQLLPDNPKSKYRYGLAYEKFTEWKQENGANHTSENVLLAYFDYLFKVQNYAPSTLWSICSMVCSVLYVMVVLEKIVLNVHIIIVLAGKGN